MPFPRQDWREKRLGEVRPFILPLAARSVSGHAHEAAAQFLQAAGDRRAGAAARTAAAARAHDPFRAAAYRESARQGAGADRAGRRRARQSRRRHSGRRQGGGARGFIAMAKACDFGDDRIVDAHQRAQFALGARRHHRDRRRDRQQARRHHAAEGRGRLGHPLSRSASRSARSQARASRSRS